MRRSKQSREIDEVVARLDAEDRVVVYLSNFPRQVALATALKVELLLATMWEAEQNEMLRRDDPREVVQIYPEDFEKIERAFAKILTGIQSDADAEKHVIAMLAKFPPDRAWWIARTVVMHETYLARIRPDRQAA
jgi:hypothetical protein